MTLFPNQQFSICTRNWFHQVEENWCCLRRKNFSLNKAKADKNKYIYIRGQENHFFLLKCESCTISEILLYVFVYICMVDVMVFHWLYSCMSYITLIWHRKLLASISVFGYSLLVLLLLMDTCLQSIIKYRKKNMFIFHQFIFCFHCYERSIKFIHIKKLLLYKYYVLCIHY